MSVIASAEWAKRVEQRLKALEAYLVEDRVRWTSADAAAKSVAAQLEDLEGSVHRMIDELVEKVAAMAEQKKLLDECDRSTREAKGLAISANATAAAVNTRADKIEAAMLPRDEWAKSEAENAVWIGQVEKLCALNHDRLDSIETRGSDRDAALETLRLDVRGAESRCLAIESRLAKLEGSPPAPPPVDPPAPPPDPPIVVEEGPIVIEGSGRVEINLGDREVWPGFRTEANGYRISELIFRGAGIVRPREGVPALEVVNLAGGGTCEIIGDEQRGCEWRASGDDVPAIRAPQIARLGIAEALIRANQRKTADRHARPCAIYAPQTHLGFTAVAVLGGNSSCYSEVNESEFWRCFFSPQQFAVNGYCITRGQVGRSILFPLGSGRGYLAEHVGGSLDECCILGWDRGALSDAKLGEPDRLYDRGSLDGPAVRVRYGAAVNVDGCRILTIGGGQWNNATGIMLSHSTASVIQRNWIAAVNVAPGSTPGDSRRNDSELFDDHFRARPISFESQGTFDVPAGDVIDRNEFWGNQYLWSTTGSDNATGTNQGEARENSFGWQHSYALAREWIRAVNVKWDEIARPWWAGDVRTRLDACVAEVLAAVEPSSALWPMRRFWLTGVFGPHEISRLVRPTQHAESVESVTWTEADASPSDRGGVRKLIVDDVEILAPGSERT